MGLFLDEIHKSVDRGNLPGALFVVLSKAFDTVSHLTSSQHMEFLEMKKRGLQITSFTEK